jgi:pyridoxamine 5'-phosphate oxidase
MMSGKFSHMRKEYRKGSLIEQDVPGNPLTLFELWLMEATAAGAAEPTAMVLSTSTMEGRPSSRVVLLKDVTESGFTFFTNYNSRKGKELETNSLASILFFWPLLERQVRIEGTVELVPAKDADTYFHSRPLGSQLGAWASPQSQEIDSREILDNNLVSLEKKFSGKTIPRPLHWGGYCLVPVEIEFWQGRENRLHDRLRFNRKDKQWSLVRLAP